MPRRARPAVRVAGVVWTALALVAATLLPADTVGAPAPLGTNITVYTFAPVGDTTGNGAAPVTSGAALGSEGPQVITVSLLAQAGEAAQALSSLQRDVTAAFQKLRHAGIPATEVAVTPPTLDGTPGAPVEAGDTVSVRVSSLTVAAHLVSAVSAESWPGSNGFYVTAQAARTPSVRALTGGAQVALAEAGRLATGLAHAEGLILGPRTSEEILPPGTGSQAGFASGPPSAGGTASSGEVTVRVTYETRETTAPRA